MSARKKSSPLFAFTGRHDTEDLETLRDITDDVIESDFVPYACLYDAETLLTKNGELLHILRLDGVDATGAQAKNLRAAVRGALAKHLPNTQFAVWLHTLRRKIIEPSNKAFSSAFTKTVDDEWNAAHGVGARYTNALYISIVRLGSQTAWYKQASLVQSLFPAREMRVQEEALEEAHAELVRATGGVLQSLQPYGITRLGVEDRAGVPHGAHLEFLETLINLEPRPMPLNTQDLSSYLTSGDVTFSFNAMEVRTAEGKRRFAALMTLKEYRESSLLGIDEFLEIPCELIVTQAFTFTGADEAKVSYETQAEYLRYSGDKELYEWAGFGALMGEAGLGDRAFGRQQTTLFLIASSVKELEASVQMVRRALSKLGMVAVREDLRFEDMYWSQIPGNFPFLVRPTAVNMMHLGGFVHLEAPVLGNAKGSAWGPPLLRFRTGSDQLLYFNVHDAVSPHVCVIGGANSGRTTLAHLLASQARAVNARLWMLDTRGRSAPLMQALGGQVTSHLQVNPFLHDDSPSTREYLTLLMASLVDASGALHSQAMYHFFRSCIDQVMVLSVAQRTLAAFIEKIDAADPMLALKFRDPLMQRVLGGAAPPLAFTACDMVDISSVMAHPALCGVIAADALHRMTLQLDGTPTLIVLDDGLALLNNPVFGPRAAAWLRYAASKNAAVVITCRDVAQAASYGCTAAVMAEMGNVFAFTDHDPAPEYMSHFGFDAGAYGLLADIPYKQRFVMLKRGDDLRMLRGFMPMASSSLATLSGKQKKAPARDAAAVLADLMGAHA
jgi:type IV secretion system protein VirB4